MRSASTRARGRLLSGQRAFRRLWLGEALSETGSQVTAIAMPLLVLSLTHSPAKAGLVGGARAVAGPLTVLLAGLVADRLDRRRLMIACALGRLAASASVVATLLFGRPSLAQLLLVTLLDATLFSFSHVAERSLLPELVPPGQLSEAVTLNEARTATAVLAGPPAGGALFGVARSLPFAADAGSFLVALAALAGLRVPARRSRPAQQLGALRAELGEGVRWLWRHPFLRAGALLYASLNITINAVELLAILILRRHGASSAAIGGAYALLGAGGLTGAALANPLRRRLSVRAGILAEPWAYALLIPLLLLLHDSLAVGLLLAVMFLPMTLSSSIVISRRLSLAPEQLRGRVQAGGTFIGTSLAWLGPLAMGLIAQYAGDDAAVMALAAFSLLTALAATLAPTFAEARALSGPGAG